MKVNFRFSVLIIVFFATLLSITSCSKRRELKEYGCVRGKPYFDFPVYSIGAMTKKQFYQYLDSPNVFSPDGLIQYEMTWKKVESQSECPVDI